MNNAGIQQGNIPSALAAQSAVSVYDLPFGLDDPWVFHMYIEVPREPTILEEEVQIAEEARRIAF